MAMEHTDAEAEEVLRWAEEEFAKVADEFGKKVLKQFPNYTLEAKVIP